MKDEQIPNTSINDVAVPDTQVGKAPPGRLFSLDVFRGATIAAMLLVNNPGTWAHIHPPLRHAEWHGWTPTDLIFPFFLFIVGVAITYSFGKLQSQGAGRKALLAKAGRRGAVLFLLGLVLHAFPWWSPDLANLRIPGVLQRIGIAYFLASVVVLFMGVRGQAVTAGLCLLVYWALMTLVPVPGYGAGVLDVPEATLAAFIDRAVLGTQHLWVWAGTWDPEGILSTIPAVGTVLSGVLAGHWLRSGRQPLEKLAGMFIAGNVLMVLGLVWNWFFPINKPIWTSSYVLFTSGMALNVLAMCYWAVDMKQWRRWATPFAVFGVNAIAAFFLSSLFARVLIMIRVPDGTGESTALKTYIYQNLFTPWLSPMNASLAFAICYVLFWLGLMWILYSRRVFIKV